MKLSVASLGPSTQRILARIQKVRKVADKAARSERRFADYRYLRSVLSAYRYFEENDLLSHLVEIAPSTVLAPVRANWHSLRVIIEATCIQTDLRMRSRWTRALEYAVAEKSTRRNWLNSFEPTTESLDAQTWRARSNQNALASTLGDSNKEDPLDQLAVRS